MQEVMSKSRMCHRSEVGLRVSNSDTPSGSWTDVLAEEREIPNDDVRKGNIALVITRTRAKLRLISDSKSWNRGRGRPGQKRACASHTVSGSESDGNRCQSSKVKPPVKKR